MAAPFNSTILPDSYDDIMAAYATVVRKTQPIMSKYEKTKIIGVRLEQLARNFPPTVDLKDIPKPFKTQDYLRNIANEELKQRPLPFMIARTLPSGVKEYWRLEDMVI